MLVGMSFMGTDFLIGHGVDYICWSSMSSAILAKFKGHILCRFGVLIKDAAEIIHQVYMWEESA